MAAQQTQQQSCACAGAVGLAVLGEPFQGALGIGTLKNCKKISSGEEQDVSDGTNPAQRSCCCPISGSVQDQVGAGIVHYHLG